MCKAWGMDRAKEGYGGAFVELENTNKMFFNSCSFVSTCSFVYFSVVVVVVCVVPLAQSRNM